MVVNVLIKIDLAVLKWEHSFSLIIIIPIVFVFVSLTIGGVKNSKWLARQFGVAVFFFFWIRGVAIFSQIQTICTKNHAFEFDFRIRAYYILSTIEKYMREFSWTSKRFVIAFICRLTRNPQYTIYYSKSSD
mgnify:CR=1 FL=1